MKIFVILNIYQLIKSLSVFKFKILNTTDILQEVTSSEDIIHC